MAIFDQPLPLRVFSPYMSIPTESPFGNMSYYWLYLCSLSNLLIHYTVFQTIPMDPAKYPHLYNHGILVSVVTSG